MVDDTFDKIYEKYLKINEYLLSAEFVKFEIDQMQKKYGSPFYNYRIIKTLFLEGKKSISEIEEYNFGFATKGMKSRWQAIYSKIKGSKDVKKENSLLGLQILRKHGIGKKYDQKFELTPHGFVLSMILFTSSMWHSRHSFSGKSNSTKLAFFGKQGIKNSKRFLEQSCKSNQKNLPILTDIIHNVKDDEDALLALSHFWGDQRSRLDMELENTIDFYSVFTTDEERITAMYYYYLMESSSIPKKTCTKLRRKCKAEVLKFIKDVEKYVKLSTGLLECNLKISQLRREGKDIPIKLFKKYKELSDELIQLRRS